jgi:tubulin-folding cofactor B
MLNQVGGTPVQYVQVTNANNSIVKLNLTHSILNIRVPEVRFDLFQNIGDIKRVCEKKFGTPAGLMSLILQDSNGNNVCAMSEDDRNLGYYTPQENYTIHCMDLDPNSTLKDLEDVSQVEKFKISEEDYNKLPDSFRKFKQKLLNQPGQPAKVEVPKKDEDFMKDLAQQFHIGARCQLKGNENRGVIKYIGTVIEAGEGWWIGVRLDEPLGKHDGSTGGTKYFDCPPKYGIFARPDKVEEGDFPELDLDEI